jgi:hypothetical protein
MKRTWTFLWFDPFRFSEYFKSSTEFLQKATEETEGIIG